MNQRQKELLHRLLQGDTWTIQALADELQASERTIRNDLVKIEALLTAEQYQFTLAKKPGVGLSFESPQKAQILKDLILQETDIYGTAERRDLLLFHLLMATQPMTLTDLAELLFVNRQMIREDLSALQIPLFQQGLTITIKPKTGVFLEGSEGAKRELLAQTLKKLQQEQQPTLLTDFFSPREMKVIQLVVNSFEANHGFRQQTDFNSIMIHLFFMVARLRKHATIQLGESEWQLIRHSKALDYARELAQQLSLELGLRFPEDEIGYLALRVAAFYTPQDTQTSYLHEADRHINEMITALITEVHLIMDYDLSADERLQENLRMHLNATFTRIASGFHISNPLKDEILKNYTQLFLIVQSIAEEFKEPSWQIPDEEIAYLTVHLQGAIERLQEQQTGHYRTVIVCNYGIGVSAFIEAKIKRLFPTIETLALLAVDEFPYFPETEQLDFVLSTVPLTTELPVFEISPLFESTDQQKLNAYLATSHEKATRHFDISQFTNPFLVQTQLPLTGQAEVLQAMVANVRKKNYVTDKYLVTVLAREAKASTRVGSLIALPHGDPTEIKHSFLAIATLAQPVDWGYGQVQFLVLIGLQKDALGNEEVKKFFSLIHYLVEDQTALTAVLGERNPLDLLKRLSTYH